MVDIVVKTALTFLVIYGFVQVIADIAGFFFKTKKSDDELFIVIKVKNSADSLESTVRLIIWKWLCASRGRCVPNILIVDMGSDDDTAEISRKLCDDFEFIYYTTHELYSKAKNR